MRCSANSLCNPPRRFADVFVTDVQAADNAALPIHDDQLAVVTKIDLKSVHPALSRVEGMDVESNATTWVTNIAVAMPHDDQGCFNNSATNSIVEAHHQFLKEAERKFGQGHIVCTGYSLARDLQSECGSFRRRQICLRPGQPSILSKPAFGQHVMTSHHAPKIEIRPTTAGIETRMCFVSDLHCFSSRSTAIEHEPLIRQVIQRSDVCVWGGDLFDFRWSRMGHHDDSIAASLAWLDRYYEEFPTKQFVFLSGNHDADGRFVDRLHQWAGARDRFQCGMDALIAGDVMFVHGDVIEGGASDVGFASYRRSWHNKPIAHARSSRLYDAAVSARLHIAVALAAHRRRRTCKRLARWVHRQDQELIRPVRRVVFGHTHRWISHYHLAGLDFYNGGAAIKHVMFSPVELTV